MRHHYRRDCLRLVAALSEYTTGITREVMAQRVRLSVTGACARFRNLRKYGCVVSCYPLTVTGFSGKPVTRWNYKLIHAPKRVREAAGI